MRTHPDSGIAVTTWGRKLPSRPADELIVTTATLSRIGKRSADRRKLAEVDYEGREIVLSPRQLEVLGLVAAGLTNEEIAPRLSLSPETVKRHITQGLYKLRATNRAHAVSICFRRGLIR